MVVMMQAVAAYRFSDDPSSCTGNITVLVKIPVYETKCQHVQEEVCGDVEVTRFRQSKVSQIESKPSK